MTEKKKAKKPTQILWIKENGTKLFTNDHPENIAKAKELGWKEHK